MINRQVNPDAFYDSLSLAHKLDNYLDGFKLEEVHLFSYFSSILFLYDGNMVSEWDYRFVLDSNGYPFSNEVNDAINRHIQNGLFEAKSSFYSISGRGTDEFNRFRSLPTFSRREKFLDAACSTSILVPYTQTLRALLMDPEIKKVKELQNRSWLEQSNIYEKFAEISQAVGVASEDLVIPAITWINYINERNSKN